jgi:hypothetical protein
MNEQDFFDATTWKKVAEELPPPSQVVWVMFSDTNTAKLKFEENRWKFPDGSWFIQMPPVFWKAV